MAEDSSDLRGEGNSNTAGGRSPCGHHHFGFQCTMSYQHVDLVQVSKCCQPSDRPKPWIVYWGHQHVSNLHLQEKAFLRTRRKSLTRVPPRFRAESQSWSQTRVNAHSSLQGHQRQSQRGTGQERRGHVLFLTPIPPREVKWLIQDVT